MPKLEIASNRFRHFSKPCKANRQGRLATNAPKLHDFGGGDTLWNPVHYFFVNFGDFWYISNAGCNAHFFLQLYFTIKLEVFDPISLVEGDFPAEKKQTHPGIYICRASYEKCELLFCRPDDVSVSCRSTAIAGTYACHDVCVAVVDNHGPHGILRCNHAPLSYLLLTGN